MNPEILNVFFINKKVLFPHCTTRVRLRHSRFSDNLQKGDRIIVFPVRNLTDFIFIKRRIATLSEIMELEKSNGKVNIHLKGLARVHIRNIKNVHKASFEIVHSSAERPDPDLLKELRKKAQELVFLINVEESDKLIKLMNFLFELDQITDFIANYFVLDYKLRINLLNNTDTNKRSNKLLIKLNQLIKKMELPGEKK